MGSTSRIVGSAVIALLWGRALGAQQRAPDVPPGLDAFAARVLQEFRTPGAAVAVVRDSRTVDFSFDWQDLRLEPVRSPVRR